MKTDSRTCLEAITAVQSAFMKTNNTDQAGLQFLESMVALTQSSYGVLSLVSGKTPVQWHARDLFQDRLLTYTTGACTGSNLADSLQYHHVQDMCAIAVDKHDIFIHNSHLFPTDDLPDAILPLHTLCIVPLFFQHRLFGICICCNRKKEYTRDYLLELQPLIETFTIIRSSSAASGYSPQPQETAANYWEHIIDETNPRLDRIIHTTLGTGKAVQVSPIQNKIWQEEENLLKDFYQIIISNLEMINGVFELQKLFTSHPQLAACFHENSLRIKALSAVYELQAASHKLGFININQYLHIWLPAFSARMNLEKPVIFLEESCPEVILAVDQAIACISLLNEILLLAASIREDSHKMYVSAFREQDTLQLSITSDKKANPQIISSQMRFALIHTWADLLNACETIELKPLLCFDYRFKITNA